MSNSSHSVKAMALIKALLLLALFLAIATVMVSSYIRLVESGLGCSDWPSCYGKYAFNESAQGVTVLTDKGEHSPHRMARIAHRAVTTLLGILVLALFVVSRMPKYREITGRVVPLFLLVLTLALAAIGGIHPTEPWPILTLGNFVGGLLLVGLLTQLYLTLTSYPSREFLPDSPPSSAITTSIRVGIFLIALQILLGGWTSANYAGASCDTLFHCEALSSQSVYNDDPLLARLSLDETLHVVMQAKMPIIQLIHHIGAVVTLIYFLVLALILMRGKNDLCNHLLSIFGLLIVQVVLGLSALLFHLPLLMVFLHNFFAAILIIMATTINQKLTTRVLL